VNRRDPLHDGSHALGRDSVAGHLPLLQAAMRRRSAERAFEDYVREMAQRWTPPAAGDDPGAGKALPKV
jgi:hypothetical protein